MPIPSPNADRALLRPTPRYNGAPAASNDVFVSTSTPITLSPPMPAKILTLINQPVLASTWMPTRPRIPTGIPTIISFLPASASCPTSIDRSPNPPPKGLEELYKDILRATKPNRIVTLPRNVLIGSNRHSTHVLMATRKEQRVGLSRILRKYKDWSNVHFDQTFDFVLNNFRAREWTAIPTEGGFGDVRRPRELLNQLRTQEGDQVVFLPFGSDGGPSCQSTFWEAVDRKLEYEISLAVRAGPLNIPKLRSEPGMVLDIPGDQPYYCYHLKDLLKTHPTPAYARLLRRWRKAVGARDHAASDVEHLNRGRNALNGE